LVGVIHYAIENNRIAKEYLTNFTNAAFIVKEGFKLAEDGLYSGSMQQRRPTTNPPGITKRPAGSVPPQLQPSSPFHEDSLYLTLQHPRCVFQLLKKQYSRYTPEMVERITGIPKNQFLKAADLFNLHSQGWRHEEGGDDHVRGRVDTAYVRHADHPYRGDVAIDAGQRGARRRLRQCASRPLQHPGATDMGGVFDIWPGYLKVPNPTMPT